MNIYRKFVLTIITVCAFINIFTTNIFACSEQITSEDISVLDIQNDIAIPYSEKTGYKYKYIGDIKYKRLWSYTYNRWIDEFWSKA